MIRDRRLATAVGAVLLASLGLSATQAVEVAWVESFEKAQELAKKSGKLIMADFWMDN